MKLEYYEDFRGFANWVGLTVKERMKETVSMLCAEAKRLCPVRTGRLKKSLTWEVREDGKVGWYGSNRPWRGEDSVPYAVFQELGFRHWRSGKRIPGKFYLRGPLVTKRPEMQRVWSGYKIGVRGEFEVRYGGRE